MGLRVISGPPGSGREEIVLERFEEAVAADPLLVAPTRDDVDRLERELCARGGGALLGGTVTTLPGLFEEVRRAVGVEAGPTATRMQRVWLCRAAAREVRLRQLHRSAAREGFAPALEALVSDLQAAGLDAAGLDAAIAELDDSAYEREIGDLLSAYERLRDAAGLTDDAKLADAAVTGLRADPIRWRGRPVLLLGFDDLSRQQVELVAALGEAGDVTVAITFEAGRPALAARAELRGTLVDELGADLEPPLERRPETGREIDDSPPRGTEGETEEATQRGTGREAEDSALDRTLHHLERNLFEPDPPAVAPEPGSLRLLEGAGERSEAELVGRAVARLLADGADPDEVAVALRSPDRQAPLFARVLAGLGIPIAPEAKIPLAATATGSTLLRLLEIAGPDGTAIDVVAFLRGPARANPRNVDWLERTVLRGRMTTSAEALEVWRGGEEIDRRIWELDAIAEAGDDAAALTAAVTRIAAHLAERPHERTGFVPSAGPAVELRASAEVRRALEETAALGAEAPTASELAELLAHIRVPLWSGGTEGRVRILSPYRLRATRVRHLFVAGLSDGSFPAHAPADPLLADERRAALGIPSRSDPAAEERFLFYSCVSRPQDCLHLSYPASDESGTPKPRSPYVDEVRSLLLPAPSSDPADDPLEDELAVRAEPEDVVPAPGDATTARDLARALAAENAGVERVQGLPAEISGPIAADLATARAALAAAARPGPLSHPDVLAALGADHPYGASTLEEYDTCSYRWFVGHELRPRPIGPDPEPLEDGGLAHAVLERLYREPPTGSRRPGEDDVERWIEAAGELSRSEAAGREWDLASASARIRLARTDALIARFLRRDARTETPLEPGAELLEVSFGDSHEDQHPAARLAGFSLHGRIDRIDVAGSQALIRDYKLSSKAVAGAKLIKEGKLQMPLYLLAARTFGLEPIGGLYSPLGASTDDRPRGLMLKELKGELLPGATADAYRTDFLDEESFEGVLEEAEARASEIVDGMRAGRIARDPRDDKCPTWCGMAAICRIERGVAIEDPEAEEDAVA